MSDIISIALQADPSGMIKGFKQAEGATSKFVSVVQSGMTGLKAAGQVWDGFVSSVRRGGIKLAAYGVSSSLALGKAVQQASAFQTSMKDIQSLTKASDSQMRVQQSAMLDMSTKYPQSAQTLAEAQYDIASSGFEGADAIKILDAATVSASAGRTSAAKSTEAIVAALNAYGMSAKDAADVSDILFQGVNVGVVTFEELAGSMGQWVGMGAQVGVSFDEGVAGISAMTLAGIGAQESATYLSRLMQAFIDPSEKMTEVAKSLGYVSPKAMLDAKGLGDTLLELSKTTGGSAEKFNELFGSIQASRGAMAIVSNEGENWNRVASAITDKSGRSGAAADVYKYQEETLAVKWQKFQNSISNMAITIGQPLLAPLGVLLSVITSISNAIQGLLGNVTGALSYLGAFGSVIATVAGVFTTFLPKIIAARIAMAGFRTVSAALATSQAATGASGFFAAIGAGLSSLGGKFPRITAMMTRMGTAMKAMIGGNVVSGIGKVFGAMKKLALGQMTLSAAWGGGVGLGKAAGAKAWSWVTSGVGAATLGIGALTFALFEAWQGFNKARDAGKDFADEFRNQIDDQSFTGIQAGVRETKKSIEETRRELLDMGVVGGDTIEELRQGGQTMGTSRAAKMVFLDWLPFSDFGDEGKKFIENKTIIDEQLKNLDELETRDRQFQAAAVRIGALTQGYKPPGAKDLTAFETGAPEFDFTVPGMDQVLKNIQLDQGDTADAQEIIDDEMDNVADIFGSSGEMLQFKVQRAMKATNVSVDDLVNEDTMDGAITKVSNYMKRMEGLSVNDEVTTTSFDAIASAAGDAATQIEALGDAMDAFMAEQFGLETASDQFASSLNKIQELMSADDAPPITELADPNVNTDAALEFRDAWRNAVEATTVKVQEWAKAQEDLTGTDLTKYLQDQVNMLKMYGEAAGIPAEFMDQYSGGLEELITSGDIVTTFAVDVDEAEGMAKAYLETIGTTPENIETAIKVLNGDQSLEQIQTYLTALLGSPEEMLTFIKVYKEEAAANLAEYVSQFGDAQAQTAVIQTAIEIQAAPQGDQAGMIKDFKSDFDLTDENVNVIFELLGNGQAQVLTVEEALAAIDIMNPSPVIDVTDNASTTLDRIIAKLGNIKSKTTTVTVNEVAGTKVSPSGNSGTTGNPGGGNTGSAGNPGGGNQGSSKNTTGGGMTGAHGYITRYMQGGLDDMVKEKPGTANIYRPTAKYRVFAEPETGGESYIPLAPSKRERSVKIWKETGKRLGVFATGGITGEAAREKEKREQEFYKAMDKNSKTEQGAADDQQKAADDQKQAAEEARSNARSKWSYQYEIDGTLGPIEHIGNLLEQMRQLPQYSDEWMDIGRSIVSVKDDLDGLRDTAQDAFYELDIVDDKKYLKFLEGRLVGVRMFSQKWWDLAMEVKQHEKKIIENQQELEDTIFARGEQNLRNRIAQLMKRVAAEKVGSQEWHELRNDVLEQQMEMMRRERDYGKISNAEYIKFLQGRVQASQKYSDVWMESNNEIIQIQQDGLTTIADMYGKFSGKMVLSSENLIRWLQRQVKVGQEWKASVEKLKSSGLLGKGTIDKLIEMGPGGQGLVGAILAASEKGQGAELQKLLNLAAQLGMNTTTYDQGGYLPPGYTLAYNGTGKPERVSTAGDGGVVVNMPNAQINNPNDANRMGDRIGFAINSVRV